MITRPRFLGDRSPPLFSVLLEDEHIHACTSQIGRAGQSVMPTTDHNYVALSQFESPWDFFARPRVYYCGYFFCDRSSKTEDRLDSNFSTVSFRHESSWADEMKNGSRESGSTRIPDWIN